jgi:predicted ATPase/transcriptional regulator with XRE-family HTH domain
MASQPKPVRFAALLREQRRAAGLTQAMLAERAGLSVRGVQHLEAGDAQPYPASVEALARALGLSADRRAEFAEAAAARRHSPQPRMPGDFPLLASLAAQRHNLPVQLSSFVGRVQEITDIRRELAGARLLTLTGPGGVGKTRLALRVAEEELGTHRDGIWFVELAPLEDGTLVPQLVASALQVRENPGEPLITTLTTALQPLDVLLILDNCEHVVAACADLADRLLRGCPHVRLLVTSRELIAIQAETVWRVPPLRLPDARTREQVAASEAIDLFIERARAVQPNFALTDDNAGLMLDICRQLDGIPLAIELAAPRLRLLSLHQIEQRLRDNFRILISGNRLAPGRQQTLGATIDWSYGLLSDVERRLFRRLAVFAGGWTLAAAEAVCSGDEHHGEEVLDLLTALIDKSLVVVVEPEGRDEEEPRYRFLETVRAFASDHLRQFGELASTRDRHLVWATEWAEEAVQHLTGPDQVRWMGRFVREHDNFRAGLDWARLRGEGETELRLVAGLARFWALHGPSSEGRSWLSHALSHGPRVPSLARATALDWAGRIASNWGDSGARELLEQSVAMARELDNASLASLALRHLAFARLQQGETAAGRALHEEAVNMARLAGDRREEAFALAMIGLWEAQEGDTGVARRVVDEALEIAREVGDRGPQANALCARGIIAVREDHAEAAEESFAEALELGRASGHHLAIAMALMQLGGLALARDDALAARRFARDCVAAAQETGLRRLFAAALQFFAVVELHQHHYEHAVRLIAAESTWRNASPERKFLGLPWISGAPAVDEAQAQLGPEAFSREWSIGQRMTLEQAATLTYEPEGAGVR